MNGKYGNRTINEVSLPSSKVFMYEQFGRHARKNYDWATFYGLDSASCCVQMFDNSVSLRKSREANYGIRDPNTWNVPSYLAGSVAPPGPAASLIAYNPAPNSPDPYPPNGSVQSPVRYLYTRGGLTGADFGGSDTRTPRY